MGLLVVKDKGGGTTCSRGGPSVAALHDPAGPLATGDHLRRDRSPTAGGLAGPSKAVTNCPPLP